MISYETFCQIKDYHQRQHWTISQIADQLHLDRDTVAKWLARTDYQRTQRTPRASKLDPFKADIARWLEAHPYSGTQIVQRLRELGYSGGQTIVRDYVQRIRPRRAPAFLKFSSSIAPTKSRRGG